MKKKNLLIILLLFFNSCGSLEETGKILRNEKITNTDEFFVKKKEPLVLPPDYKEIPTPGSLSKKKKENNSIKKILKSKRNENVNSNKSSSVEDSVIKRISK